MSALGDLKSAPVGARVLFAEYRSTFTIQARDQRWIICTRPFPPKKTVIYTVVDLQEKVRGPDDRVFCEGYETADLCRERLGELQSGELAVSRRRQVTLKVSTVLPPSAGTKEGG